MARKQRRVHGALRPYPREMRGGRTWWWVAVPRRGRVALGLACDEYSLEEATRVAAERLAAGTLAARADGLQAREDSLEGLIEEWGRSDGARLKPRSRDSYLLHLFALEEHLRGVGVTRPSQVTDEVVARWIEARQTATAEPKKAAASNATINRALAAARTLFRWASTREPPLCRDTGFARVQDLTEVGRVVHPIIPSPEEWRSCVAAMLTLPIDEQFATAPLAVERWRVTCRLAALLVAAAVETGMRLDELRHQRSADVRASAIVIAAHDGWSPKSWQERTIPCAPSTAATVRSLCELRDARPLAVNGRKVKLGDGWIADYLDRAWARAKLAGDPPRMHDCRRTFATASVRSGLGLDRVRSLLGHRDVTTSERYIGKYRSDVDAPVASLGVASLFDQPAANVLQLRGR